MGKAFYLNCWSKIWGVSYPSEENLLPLNVTNEIRENSKKLSALQQTRITIPFQEKLSTHFSQFLKRLHKENTNQIYIWTKYTNTCGLFKIDSILEFNFGFRFDVNDSGIVVLLASNLQDKITLDFYVDEERELLDLDLVGDHWSHVTW